MTPYISVLGGGGGGLVPIGAISVWRGTKKSLYDITKYFNSDLFIP